MVSFPLNVYNLQRRDFIFHLIRKTLVLGNFNDHTAGDHNNYYGIRIFALEFMHAVATTCLYLQHRWRKFQDLFAFPFDS